MLPLLPFAAGIVVGVSALGVAKKSLAPAWVDSAFKQAGKKLRTATVASLENIRDTAERLAKRLDAEEDSTAEGEPKQLPPPQDPTQE